jgi:hypothetical protein
MAKKAKSKKTKDLSPKKKASEVKGGAMKTTYSSHRW